MDIEEARSSLQAVEETRRKVRATATRMPTWYLIGSCVAIVALCAISDLNLPGGARIGVYAGYFVVVGVLLAIALRRARARARRSDLSISRLLLVTTGLIAAIIATIVVTSLIVGVLGVPLHGLVIGVVVAAFFFVVTKIGQARLSVWMRERS
ncbi:hypothetical protein [Fodinicola acaciae]|uniref:hypothetical protein n=1 Tax=Fodinicola acaciae TaxID=2681555 RepID=UPI0013D57F52|nr:hypothetical protein [Fodinicola acaciae]